MTITRRTLTAAALITAATLALGACGSSKPKTTETAAPAAEATTAEPTQSPTASATASSTPTVPGYRPGEIPPHPQVSRPPIDVLASNPDNAVKDSAA